METFFTKNVSCVVFVSIGVLMETIGEPENVPCKDKTAGVKDHQQALNCGYVYLSDTLLVL